MTDTYEHRRYLEHNLMLVATGQKRRAPGIRHCPDCTQPYIDDHTGVPYCPDCRIGHRRFCRDCRQLITVTPDGDRLCTSCANQIPLFDDVLSSDLPTTDQPSPLGR